MKYIVAGLSLMKDLGCRPQDRALDLLNALSGADPAVELMVTQACVERRFPSRTLCCRAGARDVEPAERCYTDVRLRILT